MWNGTFDGWILWRGLRRGQNTPYHEMTQVAHSKTPLACPESEGLQWEEVPITGFVKPLGPIYLFTGYYGNW